MATGSREARRRRISDCGSDRLALITGRIQSVSSSSSSPRVQHERSVSSQPLGFHDRDPLPLLSEFPHDKDKVSDSILSEHQAPAENRSVSPVNSYDENKAEPYLRRGSMSIEESVVPAAEVMSHIEPSPVFSTVQTSSTTTTTTTSGLQQYTTLNIDWELFTSDKVRSAIAASETTRLYCSLTIAILVVLSYLGFPILGCNMIKSIIAFRPLYLVLLTNLTVVIAQLLLNNQNGYQRVVREENASVSGDGWVDLLGKGLQAGLLMQKVMDAVVKDCSVYAIVVICGLSLL